MKHNQALPSLMPNFPIYRGKLPEVLNPLKLQHYPLLAYWVYFRPTAFHCYLHSCSPDLYQSNGFQKFLQTWRKSAYRNIYWMLPIASFLSALLLGLAAFLYTTSTVEHNTAWVNAIAVSQNGQIAISAGGDRSLKIKVPASDSTLRVWDLRWKSQMHLLKGHTFGVTDVAITPDGQRAVSASRDFTLRVWDIRRGRTLHELKGHKDWVSGVVVTPDGQRAVSASGDKTLMVWDLQQGTVLRSLTGHTAPILALVMTPDGRRVVSACADQTLKVWDIEQGKELYTFTGHNGWVTGVTLTPDGRQAISASLDKTLKVWDIEQGKELYTLTGHEGWVTDVAVSPDGKQAVSASADQTLKVWDLQQGKALRTFTGHNGWVTSVAITPDGKQAVSASSDQTLKVWDLQKTQARYTLAGHGAWATAIAMLPNTAQVLSASFDGYPKLWNLNQGKEIAMTGVRARIVGLNVGLGIVLSLAALGLAITVAIFMAIGFIAFGTASSIVSSLVLGLAGSLVFFFTFLTADRIGAEPTLNQVLNLGNLTPAIIAIFGIAFGLIVGVSFGLVNRTALQVFGSIVFILVIGLGAGIVVACVATQSDTFNGRLRPGIRAFQAVSITFNLLVALGALRLPFYPVQLVLALFSRFRGKWHPAVWDELLVLPVPGTTALQNAHLRASDKEGLPLIADVARNPFQRAWAQRSLHTYLHSVAAPLHFLYGLLTSKDLNTYVVAPVSQLDWQLLPTTKQVLLGELANQQVHSSSPGINQSVEGLVWGITWLARNHKQTPLTRFAAMLYQLSYTKAVEAEDFDLFSYKKTYALLTQYPGGVEIADSFEALATFLTYKHLSELTAAGDVVSKLASDESLMLRQDSATIRPSVLTALTRCGEISAEAIAYQAAVTPVEQLASLARITSALDVLDEYVVEQVVAPEQVILRRIIRQWRRIVSKAV
jgi:WD40 repeat protein